MIVKIKDKKLKTDVSVKIVNKFLEVFEYLFNKVGFALTSYPCDNESINEEHENQNFVTTFYTSDKMNGFICRKLVKEDSESDLYGKHNTYYIHYKTHDYEIKFYDNLSIWTPIEYNKETDMFCIIRSLNARSEVIYEMEFTFNIETMKFIELHDLSRKYVKVEESKMVLNKETGRFEESEILIIKSCHTKTLINKLQNRVLGDVFKLNDVT